AQFDANIALKVQTTGAERQVKKLERSIAKVEDATRDILGVDKQIVRERRALLRLTGEQATKSKQRIKDLTVQKSELALQKRELSQIVRLEKQRIAAANKRAAGPSASGGGGGGSPAGLVAAAAGAVAFSPQKLVQKSKALQALQEFRDRQNDGLEATIEDLEEKTKIYKQKLERFNEVRAARPLTTSKGTFQPTTRTSRNAFNKSRDNLLQARRDVEFSQGFTGKIDAQVASAQGEIDKATKAAARGNNVMGGFAKKLLVVAGAYVGVEQAARFASASIQNSIRAASGEQRIRALADGFDTYQSVVSRSTAAAEKFNISQIDANQQFAQLYGRLRPLGLSLDEVSTVFEGFSTAAALTGSTAAESSGALLQLSQALGAGALRGEEFNSVAEQAPAVLQAIAKEVDKPVGQLKQLAKDGKLTSDILVAALKRVKDEGADKLAAALDTPAQKVRTLQNRVEDLQVAIGKVAMPAFIGLVVKLTEVAEDAADGVEDIGLAVAYVDRVTNNFTGGAFGAFIDFLAENNAIAGITRDLKILADLQRDFERSQGTLRNFGPNYKEQELALAAAANGVEKPLSERLGIDLDGSGLGGGSGRSPADIAADQLEQGERLSKEFSRQVSLLSAQSDLERESLQIAFDRQDREEAVAKALDSQKNSLLVISDRIAALEKIELVTDDALTKTGDYIDLLKEGMEGLVGDVADEFAEFNSQTKPLEETLNGIGGILQNGVVDAISLAVTETDKLGQAFQSLAADILQAVGKALILSAITTAFKGLGGNDGVGFFSMLSGALGAREFGGPVNANSPYVVGEAGPELFIPGKSGSVVAADQFAAAKDAMEAGTAASTANADAAFADSATAMAKASTNYQNNILNTSNLISNSISGDGGMNASADSGDIRVSVNTVRVGDLDVITQEQFEAGMKATAKQTQAKVYRDLRNRPASRSRVGVG
ncbi:tape measure protein, partial [Synechococcus sp. AH-601-B19]|nr:tape measure protein [Synechococcus sp. AH-601-B19]